MYARDTKEDKKSQTNNPNASMHVTLGEVLHMYTKSIIQVNFSDRLDHPKFRRTIPSFPFVAML